MPTVAGMHAVLEKLDDVTRELRGVRLRKVAPVGVECLVAVERDELEAARGGKDLGNR